MSFETIELDGIKMEWCCDKLENYLKRLGNGTLILRHRNERTGVWLKVSSYSSMPAIDPIDYCPFCGTRIAITHDPYDALNKNFDII